MGEKEKLSLSEPYAVRGSMSKRRQEDSKHTAAMSGPDASADAQHAAVLLHHFIYQRQSQAIATSALSSKKRIEHARQLIGGDAGTGIGKGDAEPAAALAGAFSCARDASVQASALRHGINRVQQDRKSTRLNSS